MNMRAIWKRGKITVIISLIQITFIVLFGIFVDYAPSADASAKENSLDPGMGGADPHGNILNDIYPMFMDVHVMMFIGFGFLMTFLKRYGFSSLGFNFLIAAFVLEWATLVQGFLESEHNAIKVDIITLLQSDFTAAAVLISFGALLGKASLLQLIVMALMETVIFKVNEWIGLHFFHAVDIGGSMFVHVFGAYFGIACARVIYNEHSVKAAESKQAGEYHSDLFSMIGTLFLWMFWPSFNSALAPGDDQHRAIINTYYSLAACTVTAFAVSSMVNKHNKFEMEHIQNSTLAGGVAVGTMADMMIHPWGAMLVGIIAGAISVVGYKYLSPFLAKRFKLHDTCGVNNLHGIPGLIAGLGGIVASALATEKEYGYSLYQIFPARAPAYNSTEFAKVTSEFSVIRPGYNWSALEQASMQAAALALSLGMAIVGGIVVGIILRIPIWDQPTADEVFDDTDFWEMPNDGVPPVPTVSPSDNTVENKDETSM